MDENTRLLRTIVRLLAVQVSATEVPGEGRPRSQWEKIELLASAGMAASEIAEILGTTPNTVSVSLAKRKRAKQQARLKPEKNAAKQTATKLLPAPSGDDRGDDSDDDLL